MTIDPAVEALKKQAESLANVEIMIATNSGTYGAEECCRCVGSGDPIYGDYRVIVRVGDGRVRVEGCDPDIAPGYRRGLQNDLAHLRLRLADLRRKIKASPVD